MSESNNDDSKPNNESSAERVKICWYCKSKNLPDYGFCLNCGKSLSSKICHKCSFSLPMEAKFCTNCGEKFDNSKENPQNTINIAPQVSPNYPYYPNYYPTYPFNYNYTNFFEKPKWWHLPVVYIIFCIFGLLILSQLFTIPVLLFLGIQTIQFQDAVYIDILTKLIQLSLIFLAIKYFKGMKTFFSERQRQENDSSNTKKKDILSTKSMNIITKFLYVLLFVILLLAVDLYGSLIISFIEELLNINYPTTSSYSFINSDLNQYFFLIFFWACIFAPIHEEILFRGILQQSLDRSDTSDFVHYIIQGTTFAFMHLAGDILNGGTPDFILLHMILTFSFAIASTYLRKKFHSLIPSILFHSLSNTLSLSFSFLTTSYFTINQLNIIELGIYILPLALIPSILILLYAFGHWKIKKPSALYQDKNRPFIFKLLLLALLVNISQYAFLIIPNQMNQLVFLFILAGITFVVYIVWGSKVKDLTFQDVLDNKPYFKF